MTYDRTTLRHIPDYVDPPTARTALPSNPWPAAPSHRDLLLDAYESATARRRQVAIALVSRFVTEPNGQLVRLADLSWSARWAAHLATRAAERLLRVPDGTVRAATAEMGAGRTI